MINIFKAVYDSIIGGYGSLVILADDCEFDKSDLVSAAYALRRTGIAVEFDQMRNMTVTWDNKQNASESILGLLMGDSEFEVNSFNMWDNYLYSIAGR